MLPVCMLMLCYAIYTHAAILNPVMYVHADDPKKGKILALRPTYYSCLAINS